MSGWHLGVFGDCSEPLWSGEGGRRAGAKPGVGGGGVPSRSLGLIEGGEYSSCSRRRLLPVRGGGESVTGRLGPVGRGAVAGLCG